MTSHSSLPTVVVALDVPTPEAAEALVQQLAHLPIGFKVGMELFYGSGLPWLQRLQTQVAFPIFVDLKLHDIPNTVGRTAAQLVRGGVRWFNVHASGGKTMMRAALESAVEALPSHESAEALTLLGVTVLTSWDEARLTEELQISTPLNEYVTHLAQLTQAAKLHGVVCSAQEARQIQQRCGETFLRVTPGIRLAGGHSHDQQRILTPQAALNQGATTLVVGRAITQATHPVMAAQTILAQIAPAPIPQG